ncbi:hypothetical protein GCM10018790_65300 [Kitasatospora xanthocidica]|nr:hypothetical protein GCM10018790_65300 [Kitasatospora xanthocidica]
MDEQDQRSGALLDQVQAPGGCLDGAVARVGGRCGVVHRFSSVHGRPRLPADHAARRPRDANTLVILANWQDRAVEAARPEGAGRR